MTEPPVSSEIEPRLFETLGQITDHPILIQPTQTSQKQTFFKKILVVVLSGNTDTAIFFLFGLKFSSILCSISVLSGRNRNVEFDILRRIGREKKTKELMKEHRRNEGYSNDTQIIVSYNNCFNPESHTSSAILISIFFSFT